MLDHFELAVVRINNLLCWLQGQTILDNTGWSQGLSEAMNAEKQNEIYEAFKGIGAINNIGEVKNIGIHTFFIDFTCGKYHWFLSLKLDECQEIVSVLFTPNNAKNTQKTNIPKDAIELVKEEYCSIGITDHVSIEASITYPKKRQPKALVVFIHGSGPADKNENVGYSTPFFDLAIGLAQNDIANIRFDKRTWTYPFITIKDPIDEIIEDSIAAIHLIVNKFNNPGIPLFILGHSQGGTFLTQVIEKISIKPKGVILLAVPSDNDLHSRMIDQLDYLLQRDMKNSDRYLHMKDEVIKSSAAWKSYKASRIKDGNFIFNFTAEYLDYLDSFNPVDELMRFDGSILLLQGEDDYKVLANKDFVEWKNKLSVHDRLTSKLYKNLEHCFVDSALAELNHFSQVDPEVIREVSHWILHLSD